jgi:hypothetical protein
MSDPLINSHWACGRKIIFGKGFVEAADVGKPVLEQVCNTLHLGMLQGADYLLTL